MILLMRHGESTANLAGVMQGQDARPPLTERGRAQVAATAQRLAALTGEDRVRSIVTSPAVRARQSADLVGGVLGLGVQEDPRLVEKGLQEDWTSLEQRLRLLLTPDVADGTLLVTHGDVMACAAHLLAGHEPRVPANAALMRLTHGGRPSTRTPVAWAVDVLG